MIVGIVPIIISIVPFCSENVPVRILSLVNISVKLYTPVMDENPADLIAPLHYNSRKVYTITLPTKLVKGMKLQEGDYLHLQITPVLRPSTPAK